MKKILFKAEMVRAILEGKKTQTRRIHSDMSKPRYNVGETVYVGEAWVLGDDPTWDGEYPQQTILYKATDDVGEYRFNSGMFMPEKYSRIRLKITGVQKERICDISDADAIAEGFAGRADFWRYFAEISPNTPHSEQVWVYTFEVVK